LNYGKVLYVSQDDLEKKSLTFFWVKGSMKGIKYRVTCTAILDGKKKSSKTTFRVFAPAFDERISIRKITKRITIGNYPDCKYDHNLQSWKWAQYVYLGRFEEIVGSPESACAKTPSESDRKNYENWHENCQPVDTASEIQSVKGEAGIILKHKIIMPPFEDESNILQYIQIVREKNLEYNGIKYLSTENGEHDGVMNWIFDTDRIKKYVNYLDKIPCPYKRGMNDTPGRELGGRLEKSYQYQQFRTYLMFRPSEEKDDPDSIWVPLERVDWAWMYGVELSPDKRGYKLTVKRVIPGSGKLKPISMPSHPEWHGYAADPEYYEHRYNLTKSQFEQAVNDLRKGME
jgi:hypothetical protein